ncbi:MAG: tRNA (adenosine(37)-N6)-threonylcarbamoyltransferase complex ATPase subunit type 1 TsaE [Victivallaceae bacterium]
MGRNCRLITKNERATVDVGFELGKTLNCGDVVVFYGDFGSGKTAFIRGLVLGFFGLGYREPVTSPSFGGLNIYMNDRLCVYHYDLYRFPPHIVPVVFDDVESDRGVVCIEWGEKLSCDFQKTITVDISYCDVLNEREISIDDNRSLLRI